MDDRKTALAVFICIMLVMVYTQLVIEPYRQQFAPPTPVPGASPVQGQATSSSPGRDQPAPLSGPSPQGTGADVSVEELVAAPIAKVRTDNFELEVSHLGARLSNVKLLGFKVAVDSDKPLEVVRSEAGRGMPLGIYREGLDDRRVTYRLAGVTGATIADSGAYVGTAGEEVGLSFVGTFPDGSEVRKKIAVAPDSYFISVGVQFSAAGKLNLPFWLEWNQHLTAEEVKESSQVNHHEFVLLNDRDKVQHLPISTEPAELGGKHSVRWIGFGDKYFMSTAVPSTGMLSSEIRVKEQDYSYLLESGHPQAGEFRVYIGPRSYSLLRQVGHDLDRVVDLGIFAFLAHPLLWLLNFFYGFLGNYGLAIISLTLFIKTLLLPLTKASFTSMKGLQDLQPEMAELRTRFKGEPDQLNREMMALYKRKGVNPMGGCFPILLQMPVFLGLYNALLSALELRHAPFALWINDLSSPEKLMVFGIPVPLMILLMGASMFVQQAMTPTAADPSQKRVMMMMPAVFTVMFIVVPMPAGLVLYWLVNNIISITQQSYLKAQKDVSALRATVVASAIIFVFGYVLTLLS